MKTKYKVKNFFKGVLENLYKIKIKDIGRYQSIYTLKDVSLGRYPEHYNKKEVRLVDNGNGLVVEFKEGLKIELDYSQADYLHCLLTAYHLESETTIELKRKDSV